VVDPNVIVVGPIGHDPTVVDFVGPGIHPGVPIKRGCSMFPPPESVYTWLLAEFSSSSINREFKKPEAGFLR